jgi:hypothetical protein
MDEINVEVAYVIESSYMVNADVDGTSVQKELEFDVASYEENILNLYLELYFSSVKQAECSFYYLIFKYCDFKDILSTLVLPVPCVE